MTRERAESLSAFIPLCVCRSPAERRIALSFRALVLNLEVGTPVGSQDNFAGSYDIALLHGIFLYFLLFCFLLSLHFL